jgi:hypothetical protein
MTSLRPAKGLLAPAVIAADGVLISVPTADGLVTARFMLPRLALFHIPKELA